MLYIAANVHVLLVVANRLHAAFLMGLAVVLTVQKKVTMRRGKATRLGDEGHGAFTSDASDTSITDAYVIPSSQSIREITRTTTKSDSTTREVGISR